MEEYTTVDTPREFVYPPYYKERIKQFYPNSKELQRLIDNNDIEIPFELWKVDDGAGEDVKKERIQLWVRWGEMVDWYFEENGM